MAAPAAPREPPLALCCPISLQLMQDPVLAEDGVTYDRVHLQRWIQAGNGSPVTRQLLRVERLVSNRAVRDLIDLWKNDPHR